MSNTEGGSNKSSNIPVYLPNLPLTSVSYTEAKESFAAEITLRAEEHRGTGSVRAN